MCSSKFICPGYPELEWNSMWYALDPTYALIETLLTYVQIRYLVSTGDSIFSAADNIIWQTWRRDFRATSDLKPVIFSNSFYRFGLTIKVLGAEANSGATKAI